eukprot:1139688-Pelagomonas_calceolata.AAC.5
MCKVSQHRLKERRIKRHIGTKSREWLSPNVSPKKGEGRYEGRYEGRNEGSRPIYGFASSCLALPRPQYLSYPKNPAMCARHGMLSLGCGARRDSFGVGQRGQCHWGKPNQKYPRDVFRGFYALFSTFLELFSTMFVEILTFPLGWLYVKLRAMQDGGGYSGWGCFCHHLSLSCCHAESPYLNVYCSRSRVRVRAQKHPGPKSDGLRHA